MTIAPLGPDVPVQDHDDAPSRSVDGAASFGSLVSRALDAVGGSLERADAAEKAFIHGSGGLQEMMVERAQADVMLSIAATAASRTAQAVSTILGMQV